MRMKFHHTSLATHPVLAWCWDDAIALLKMLRSISSRGQSPTSSRKTGSTSTGRSPVLPLWGVCWGQAMAVSIKKTKSRISETPQWTSGVPMCMYLNTKASIIWENISTVFFTNRPCYYVVFFLHLRYPDHTPTCLVLPEQSNNL